MKKQFVILFLLIIFFPCMLFAQANKTAGQCSLYVTSQPKGATIFLGNDKQGKTPLYLESLPYGQVTLYACLEGYTTEKQVVECRARRGQKIHFLLNKLGKYGRLYVQTTPEEARIRIMNILMGFHNGLRLSPGEYRVQVSHPGYDTVERWAEVRANQNSTLDIELTKDVGRLYVHPTPKDAKVRIMNIMPPYRPGIELKPDNYRINVSKRGYKTKEQWVSISKGDEKHVSIDLRKDEAEQGKDGRGSLLVHPYPEDAKVRIMNIIPPYKPGIRLDPGKYRVNVSKKGYRTKEVSILLDSGQEKELEIRLQREERQEIIVPKKKRKEQKGCLYVKTDPEDASIEILNIKKSFENGMELGEGRYKISVDKKGYIKQQRWIHISSNSTEEVLVKLEKQRQKIKTWTEDFTNMEFVYIPGGYFLMGCGSWVSNCNSDEMPAHKVYVDGFWLGRYEVTQKQWDKLMGDNPSYFKKGGSYPVEQVSWDMAQSFIDKLNDKYNGQIGFRLPTEEEWEYAARSGGKRELYAGGGIPEEFAWYKENSNATTHSVGNRAPNGLGLYDMSGNVWEWCQDIYSKTDYSQSPDKGLGQKKDNKPEIIERVRRGGSWAFGKNKIRTTYRGKYPQGLGLLSLGFRVVRDDVDR